MFKTYVNLPCLYAHVRIFLAKKLSYDFTQHKFSLSLQNFFTHSSKSDYSSSESLEEYLKSSVIHLITFSLLQFIYILLKTLADSSFHSFREQNQLISLTNKYNMTSHQVFF